MNFLIKSRITKDRTPRNPLTSLVKCSVCGRIRQAALRFH